MIKYNLPQTRGIIMKKLPYPINNIQTYYDLRAFYQKIRSFKRVILLLAVIASAVTILFVTLYYLDDKNEIFSYLGSCFGGLTFVLWIICAQWHTRQNIIRRSMITPNNKNNDSSFYDKNV